ncbi:hypothetical protein Rhe02_38230 [Rhizocola hellebori]|uniref:Nitroreductase domain-containing protein n=1 Tax=Rhizocola hellebori TaxID=1392758 RepID=A0A8J3VH81_9ACTN|nr:nitroreductase family protein [Rhizocola hellebori]GIH05756.1 hypothetical protein Rhe02_38230 [Rhizocola hellebori]
MPLIAESQLWPETLAALEEPPHGTPLHEVFDARRSVRTFSRDPVPRTVIGSLLHGAACADAALWPHGTSAPTPEAWVATNLSDPAIATLGRFDDGRPADAQPLGELAALLAGRYAAAPVLLLVCADVSAAVVAQGGAGYRQALLRASGFGYAAWLCAIANGLSGCPFGRASAEVTSLVRKRTGSALRHLFTLALGRPEGDRR